MNKFGVEIEINSFDNRDFVSNPLKRGEIPNGINEVFDLIYKLDLKVEIQNWGYNHNNSQWICKPDASCGIEICSPVFEFDKLEIIHPVLSALSKDERIKTDDKCSLHVHADVSFVEDNYNSNTLCSILSWWIKCEHVFIDFATKERKTNQFCRFIGKTDLFDHEEDVCPFRVVSKLSNKYLTLNTFHLFHKRRKTIEFRLAEGTTDFNFVKNWISIIDKFLNSAINSSPPENYLWLDPDQVFDFLNFNDSQKELQIWFLKRLISNSGIGSFERYSKAKYNKILDKILSN